ncbi:Transcriptional activator protein AnoR [Pandoraea terrae]|uniref:Transcriptional activator protein AnoR n=2 Tax=Pandoraea terrae TaxID=1537710 RepID=A0A5E4ZFT9_9BURK|nr:Transcriptional activator protein AnoR [Pandoraea terrae]
MSALIDLLETIHQDSQQVDDARQLFTRIVSFSERIGFEYCSYGFRGLCSATQSSVQIFDTYPEGWMKHYQQQGFLEVDPTVQSGLHSDNLILWQDTKLPAHKDFWRDAHDFGVNHGLAQANWGPHGEFGLLSFGRSAEVVSAAEVKALEVGMRALSNYTHVSMSRLLRPASAQLGIDKLSLREREVLMWTAEGKTADEIGDILCISARTVNFHIQNCLDKTLCRNKVQAAIKLMLWG